jgi:hypothetical protein
VIRRWLFNFASAVSLCLCLGTLAIWVRSHWILDSVEKGITSRWEFCCYSDYETITFCLGRWTYPGVDRHFRHESLGDLSSRDIWAMMDWTFGDAFRTASCSSNGWGFKRHMILGMYAMSDPTAEPPGTVDCWYVRTHYWQLVCALGILPALSLIRSMRARSKLAKGGCGSCSYNLTANTSGICPECGTPVPTPIDAKH